MARTITAADARVVLTRVHSLDLSRPKPGKEGVMEALVKHRCIQSDPIDVAGTNHDLTLQSRVVGYKREQLYTLLYKERRLFEYFCKMHSIMPVDFYPVFRHKMDSFWNERRIKSFFKTHRREASLVRGALEKGPVSSRDLEDFGSMKWGWGHNTRISNVILTRLWVAGRALIYDRVGAVKYYSLPEKVISRRLLNAAPPEKGEDIIEIAKAITSASRLVTAGGGPSLWYEVGKTMAVEETLKTLEKRGDVFQLSIEGSRDRFYALSADSEEWDHPLSPEGDFVRFLAPLDPLMWDRKVFKIVYGKEYSWEVYKRPADRRYGYYCLPIVFNNQYVGLIEPYFRKEDYVLEIRSLHILDDKINHGRFLGSLREEISRFCSYLGAERMEVKRAPGWTKAGLRLH